MILLAGTVAAQPRAIVIAALGDSLIHGYGLRMNDGFVPVLQRWLDEKEVSARIINAGVSGDTTAGGLARLDWSLGQDVDAVIVCLGGNDMLRGIFPEHSRQNLEGILAGARDRGLPVLLLGVEPIENYGPEYGKEFGAIYTELASAFDVLFFPDFFEPLDRDADRETARRLYMQDDGLHPNEDGVLLIVDAVGPLVADLVDRARES